MRYISMETLGKDKSYFKRIALFAHRQLLFLCAIFLWKHWAKTKAIFSAERCLRIDKSYFKRIALFAHRHLLFLVEIKILRRDKGYFKRIALFAHRHF